MIASMPGRILIVDDDECLWSGYREYFAALGYQVDCARELEEAQALLAHLPYAVVITDLRLSKLGFGGLELVKFVRDQSIPAHIIVLTGYGWPEIKMEAMVHGVDAFFQKPMRLQDIVEKIEFIARGKA
jgi:two-component system, NtrC family, sensor histidine kinase HydH